MRLAPALAPVLGAAVLIPAALAADASAPRDVQWQLAGGPAVKIEVRADGWYRVPARALRAAGLARRAPAASLRLFADGREVPIVVRPDGSIEFFGLARTAIATDTRTYWLAWGGARGKRIARARATRARAPAVATFPAKVEQRLRTVYYAFLKQGAPDNFFGPRVTPGKPATVRVSVPALAPRSAATVAVAVQGVSEVAHRAALSVNGTRVATATFAGRQGADLRGKVPRGTLRSGANAVSVASLGGDLDFTLVWRVEVAYSRLLQASGNRLSFVLPRGRSATVRGFSGRGVRVLDVSRPTAPVLVPATVRRAGRRWAVTVPAAPRFRRLYAVADAGVLRPARVFAERPSQLHRAGQGADLVIVTHRDFVPALAPLVSLHRREGLSVKVVDVDDVYDEFGFGAHGVVALRAFLRYAYETWQTRPRYVLLVGDGSVDPQNYLGKGNTDFVPTKMVDVSTTRAPSDTWTVDFDGNGVPDIPIGRLPVSTRAEAAAVVAKIVSYEARPSSPARALFVADSDPYIDLEGAADELQQLVEPSMTVERRYRRDSPSRDAFRAALLDDLRSGPALVDYVGHGGPGVWGREGFFFPGDSRQLTNSQLSVYVMTSCLNAWFVDPAEDALGEALLDTPAGGAVAVVSSSGPETLEAGQRINADFLQALLAPNGPAFGDALQAAQRASGGGNEASVALLFGDPAARLR